MAELARLEASVMLDALSRRVSKIEVHEADPDINNLIQSMKTLTVSLHA
ncbi:hypothetical protein [Sphingobium yanoikuyae]|nr:hypothetical protein [Sphingobium yanoikuyae]